MWWLAFPLGYVAKKIYGGLTEPDDITVDAHRALGAQKGLRTKARKKAVTEILSQRRKYALQQIEHVTKAESAGKVVLTQQPSGRQVLYFEDIDNSLRKLKSALKILEPDIKQAVVQKPILKLEPIDKAVEKIAKAANAEYGAAAGLTVHDTYNEDLDPFLKWLRKDNPPAKY